jgi:hypothetical protein
MFCTHTLSKNYVNKTMKGDRGRGLVGENDTEGLNVTVWEGGQVSKRSKI